MNGNGKVYKVVESFEHGSFTSWVTENGKILQTSLDYESGLQGTYILDPCVNVDVSWWQDANHSFQDLYWFTEDKLDGLPYSVTEVEYAYSFNEPVLNGQIGNRKVVTPVELLSRTGKPVASAV